MVGCELAALWADQREDGPKATSSYVHPIQFLPLPGSVDAKTVTVAGLESSALWIKNEDMGVWQDASFRTSFLPFVQEMRREVLHLRQPSFDDLVLHSLPYPMVLLRDLPTTPPLDRYPVIECELAARSADQRENGLKATSSYVHPTQICSSAAICRCDTDDRSWPRELCSLDKNEDIKVQVPRVDVGSTGDGVKAVRHQNSGRKSLQNLFDGSLAELFRLIGKLLPT
ncbi:hypothetical protein SISNIDRAFT_488313 [Sistotremastrum niveocremeum HHB9708]|uniref:Uncharacterized protein n=1 Tax=Sistotremastrum niveocremeum HHB9708 TaxID=1314777 RepID=A0A164RBY4_9AGAM|nr:hypothetical protein SISNIDRAFT_488313 [Sistotremastrum niveocremeum HHB9708]